MTNWLQELNKFILQAEKKDLKTSSYPKDWDSLRIKVSFGMGAPARIPWIAFIAPEMAVSKGIYPVYLYYKEEKRLILAYGVSETEEFGETWPTDVVNASQTVAAHFGKRIPRYGDSFVFKSYTVNTTKNKVHYSYTGTNTVLTEKQIESDLSTILEYYKKLVSITSSSPKSLYSQGLFYMEKQLEDFLVENWNNTELGKKYELINEDGESVSKQYKTDIGAIDILARDKKSKSYVVIELKKNQSSDDTVGQITRYMGWIKEHKGDKNVKGIIVAGQYDRRLKYAFQMVPNIEVFLYEVNFRLKSYTKD